jgi:hypothetical protein
MLGLLQRVEQRATTIPRTALDKKRRETRTGLRHEAMLKWQAQLVRELEDRNIEDREPEQTRRT